MSIDFIASVNELFENPLYMYMFNIQLIENLPKI